MIKCQNDIEPNVFVVNAEIYIWVGLTALCVQNAQKKVEYKTLSGKEPVLTVDASLKVAHGQDGVHNVEKLRKKENSKHRKGAPIRPLGSLDSCQLCGEQYTVVGGRQKYCPNCQHDAILAWQRPHKISYNKRPDVIQTKKERRNERKKICVYCLRPFWDSTASNLCSDYCRKQQFRMQQYLREIKRENNCNIQALEESREKYREKVKNENNIL